MNGTVLHLLGNFVSKAASLSLPMPFITFDVQF